MPYKPLLIPHTGMAKLSEEKFKEAYRQEKEPRVIRRMLAVNMAFYRRAHSTWPIHSCNVPTGF